MIAWFSIAPDDGSGSCSGHVAKALHLIEESGLTYKLGAMGTEVGDCAVVERTFVQLGHGQEVSG